jgi:hypothetical protein
MTEEDIRREYPTVKALEKLGEWWPSPDGMNFAVYEGNGEFLLGHVQCCITTNSYLGRELSEKYTLHIQQIIVCDDLRGCGILAVICKRLIDVAEEAGVFVGGDREKLQWVFAADKNPRRVSSLFRDGIWWV